MNMSDFHQKKNFKNIKTNLNISDFQKKSEKFRKKSEKL